MWELDHKEGWVPKNWYFQIVMLEKTHESPLDSTEIKPVDPNGNKSWLFIGKTEAETEAPIIWPPDMKSWLTEKDPNAGKDWGQEEKGTTEDEMAGWHHWLNRHEFEQALGNSEGQGRLGAAVYAVARNRTWLSNWTTIIILECGSSIREIECGLYQLFWEGKVGWANHLWNICYKW